MEREINKKAEPSMVRRIEDGRCLCDRHLEQECPDSLEPQVNFVWGFCDICLPPVDE